MKLEWQPVGFVKVAISTGEIHVNAHGSITSWKVPSHIEKSMRKVADDALVSQFALEMQAIEEALTKKKVTSTVYSIYGFDLSKWNILYPVIKGYFSNYEDVKKVKITPIIGAQTFEVQFWWNDDTRGETVTRIENTLKDLAKQYNLQVDSEEVGETI